MKADSKDSGHRRRW